MTATMLTDVKMPPQAIDLEEAILGALLAEADAIVEVADTLKPEHFYKQGNANAYKVILEMFAKGFPIDIMTVAEHLRKAEALESIGGIATLLDYSNRCCSSLHLGEHSKIVIEKWMRRQTIVNCSDLIKLSYEDTTDVFELCEIAEKGIFAVTNVATIGVPVFVAEIQVQLMKRNDAIQAGDVKAAGVPSGYNCVRDCIKTYGNSDMIVIAARPGMGKTAYAVGEAIEMAKMGVPVLFFSLEMSKQQIVARMLSYLTQIDVDTILKATYDEVERRQIDKAMEQLQSLKILVDDSSPSPVQIASKARRAKLQHKIGVVIIDYLQIIPHHEKNRSRNDEISYISGSLKRLAKHLDVPVITLSQLSRDVEKRSDKRPMLSDLRDGGSIEQDADMVCFLYRPSYYGERKSDGGSYEGEAEVIIAKHRNGSTGTVQIGFRANCAKYHDFVTESDNGYKF